MELARELHSLLAFRNTARPILLERLLCRLLFVIGQLYSDSYATRASIRCIELFFKTDKIHPDVKSEDQIFRYRILLLIPDVK